MEDIKEIISFTHNGFEKMWYPLSVSFGANNTTINTESIFETESMIDLIGLMFATNNSVSNHQTKYRLILKSGAKKKITQCRIRFRTSNNEYILERCFSGQYSTESKLQKIGSSVFYQGNDVIQILNKFNKPIFIGRGRNNSSRLQIFKPIDHSSRTHLVTLSNNWARMVGLIDSKIELKSDGGWSTDNWNLNRSLGFSNQRGLPPPLSLLTNLAQAVMKKRRFGCCAPLFSSLDCSTLDEFEIITILDLVKNICKEEGLQLILGISNNQNLDSMIGCIETPRFHIYR